MNLITNPAEPDTAISASRKSHGRKPRPSVPLPADVRSSSRHSTGGRLHPSNGTQGPHAQRLGHVTPSRTFGRPRPRRDGNRTLRGRADVADDSSPSRAAPRTRSTTWQRGWACSRCHRRVTVENPRPRHSGLVSDHRQRRGISCKSPTGLPSHRAPFPSRRTRIPESRWAGATDAWAPSAFAPNRPEGQQSAGPRDQWDQWDQQQASIDQVRHTLDDGLGDGLLSAAAQVQELGRACRSLAPRLCTWHGDYAEGTEADDG